MGESITAGGLEFYVENRTTGQGQDGGPSLQVRGTVDGAKVQLLRFDMFHIRPHYHYAPTGQNIQYNVDPLTVDNGIDWAISLLGAKLPQMVAKAGYAGLSTSDAEEVSKSLAEIGRRWRAQPEAVLTPAPEAART